MFIHRTKLFDCVKAGDKMALYKNIRGQTTINRGDPETTPLKRKNGKKVKYKANIGLISLRNREY